MNSIIVEGNRYEVIENLGWQGEYYAKEVSTEKGNKMVVRSPKSKIWRFWTVEDKLAPLGDREGLKAYVNHWIGKLNKLFEGEEND